jgi:hypothetical protein
MYADDTKVYFSEDGETGRDGSSEASGIGSDVFGNFNFNFYERNTEYINRLKSYLELIDKNFRNLNVYLNNLN